MTLGGLIRPTATAETSIGCWKGRRVAEAAMFHPLFATRCGCGDIELPPVPPPPEQLSCFSTAPTPQANRFRQHIRQYNTALAFTLLGVEVDLRHSASMANSVTASVPSVRVMRTVLHMHNYIYTTRAKPSNIGCNRTRHLIRSSWGACKLLF